MNGVMTDITSNIFWRLRGLTAGTVGPGLLGHVAYLAAMGAITLPIATRRLERRLRP